MLAAECKHYPAPIIMHKCAYRFKACSLRHHKFKPLVCLGGASRIGLPDIFLAQIYPDTVPGLSAIELRMLPVCNAIST